MSLRIRAAALALAAAFGLAACSSSPPSPAAAQGAAPSGAGTASAAAPATTPADPSSSMTMTMTMTPGAPADTRPVAGNAVAIKGFAFAPAALTVKAGATVTWTNDDADAHTVTSQGSGGPLQSQALTTGQTYSYTFTKPGTYAYLCTIHPFMVATVTVTP